MTSQEVCNLLGVSRSTLFRWESVGQIPKAGRDEKEHRIWTKEHVKAAFDSMSEKRQFYTLFHLDKQILEHQDQIAELLEFEEFLLS